MTETHILASIAARTEANQAAVSLMKIMASDEALAAHERGLVLDAHQRALSGPYSQTTGRWAAFVLRRALRDRRRARMCVAHLRAAIGGLDCCMASFDATEAAACEVEDVLLLRSDLPV